jgi:hypothetical protein
LNVDLHVHLHVHVDEKPKSADPSRTTVVETTPWFG